MKRDLFICQPTVFFRARVFEEIGPLDINLQYCPDYDYWIRVAKRFSIGYLNEYLANSRLHEKGKTLSRRVKVNEEILRVVKRHYGQVPARWIHSYAHFFLTQKLMPNLLGIHRDRWADQKVKILLNRDWRRFRFLSLRGMVPAQTSPLSLQISVAGRLVHATVAEKGEFFVKAQIRSDETVLNDSDNHEIGVQASKSFPHKISGSGRDTRDLSYRVKKLPLITARGKKLVLYSAAKEWFFKVAFPTLFLWRYLLMNKRIPRKEIR